jgi:hypothetical protein
MLSFDTTLTAEKTTPQQVFAAAETSLLRCYLAMIDVHTHRISFDVTRTEQKIIQTIRRTENNPNNSPIITFILCRRNLFTEPLPSTEMRDRFNTAVALQ